MEASIKAPRQTAGAISADDLANDFIKYSGHRFLDVPGSGEVPLKDFGTDAFRVAINPAKQAQGAEGQFAQDLAGIMNSDRKLASDVVNKVYERLDAPLRVYRQQSAPLIDAFSSYVGRVNGQQITQDNIKQLADAFRSGQNDTPEAFVASALLNPAYYTREGFQLPESELERVYADNPRIANEYKAKMQSIRDEVLAKARDEYQKGSIGRRIAPALSWRMEQADNSPERQQADEAYLQASAQANTPEAIEAERERLASLRDPSLLDKGAALATDILYAPNALGQAAVGYMEGGADRAISALGANRVPGIGDPRNETIGNENAGGNVASAVFGAASPMMGWRSAAFVPSQVVGNTTRALPNMLLNFANTTMGRRILGKASTEKLGAIEQAIRQAFGTSTPSLDEIAQVAKTFEDTYESAIAKGVSAAKALEDARKSIEVSKGVNMLRALPPTVQGAVETSAPVFADPGADAGDKATALALGGGLGATSAGASNWLAGERTPLEMGVSSPAFTPISGTPTTYKQQVRNMEISPIASERLHGQAFDDVARNAEVALGQARPAASGEFIKTLNDTRTGATNISALKLAEDAYNAGKLTKAQLDDIEQNLADAGRLTTTSVPQVDPTTGAPIIGATPKIEKTSPPLIPGQESVGDVNMFTSRGKSYRELRELVQNRQKNAAKQTGGNANVRGGVGTITEVEETFDKMQAQVDAITNPKARVAFFNELADSRKNPVRKANELAENMEAFLKSNPKVANADKYRQAIEDLKNANEQFMKRINETANFRDAWRQYADFVNSKALKWSSPIFDNKANLPFADRLAEWLAVTTSANAVELVQDGKEPNIDNTPETALRPNVAEK